MKLSTRILAAYYLIFFLFTWFWLYRFAGFIFYFQEKSSLFLTTTGFLTGHLDQPGGFLDYLGKLQTSLYFYPLAGAFIVSMELVAIGIFIGKTGGILVSKPVYPVSFLVMTILFYLQLNYQYQGFNTLGILIQVVTFYLTVRFLRKKGLSWSALFLFPLLYFLAGFFSVIFMVMFILYILLNEKDNHKYLKIVLLLLISVAFYIAGDKFLFYQTGKTLLLHPFSLSHTGMQGKFFFPLMAVLGLLPFILKIWNKGFNFRKSDRIILYSPLMLILIAVASSVYKTDRYNARYFHVEKLFFEQKFDQVIEYNLKHPTLNTLTGFLNNIALCETGKLCDMLFYFPQSQDGSTLFLKWEMITEVLKRGGYWYYCMGMVNEANRWAYENMVMKGNTPEGLKMLIKTELINGNYKVAAKYISILKSSFFYRKEAFSLEKYLNNEASIIAHPEFGKKIKLKPKSDFFVLTDGPLQNLEWLIKSDSTHKAALEYKFAWLLLQKDMHKIVENLPLLEKAGYTKLPLHIDEASTGYKLVRMGDFPKLQKLDISAPVIQRFDRFYRLLQQNNSNIKQAQGALAKDFSRSFWYWYFFK